MSAKFYPKATDSLAWNKPNTARPSGATTQKLLGTLDIHSLDCLNGILLPKLFWPTGRKKCSSDREKLLKFEAEGREFAKILRPLEQFIQTMKGQNNFW